jgi:glycosyltransferase involved in cell wall biosynthesis
MSEKNGSPTVTIAIPTYNRAASTLPLTLASARSQNWDGIEILVSDNGSTDHTGRLIEEMADERLRYLRHDSNIPMADNFNHLVAEARGDYFLLLHDDDTIDPDFVRTCMNALGSCSDAAIIRTGIRLISGQGDVLEEIPNRNTGDSLLDFATSWFSHRTSPYCCNTLLNTELLRAVGGFHSLRNLFLDVRAQVLVAARGRTVNVPDVLASFRRHDSNFGSSAKMRDWCEDSQQLLETIVQLLPEQAAELRVQGAEFFAMRNYRKALASVGSTPRRLRCYRMVGSMFDSPASWLGFAWRKDLLPSLRRVKRRAFGQSLSPDLP